MLDPKLKVEEASGITKRLEEKIQKEVPSVEYVVIQIESHKLKEEMYRGMFGRGFGWRGRMGGMALGPSGECVCPKCGTTIQHKRGIPCFKEKCPKCGSFMTRRG